MIRNSRAPAARYAGVRLRDLCAEMHRFFRDAGVSALQRAQFAPEHLPEMAMPPHDAACLVRNDVDYLPDRAIAGPIATTPSWSIRRASPPSCRASGSTSGPSR